jgi:hypothetical protein
MGYGGLLHRDMASKDFLRTCQCHQRMLPQDYLLNQYQQVYMYCTMLMTVRTWEKLHVVTLQTIVKIHNQGGSSQVLFAMRSLCVKIHIAPYRELKAYEPIVEEHHQYVAEQHAPSECIVAIRLLFENSDKLLSVEDLQKNYRVC